MISGLIATIIIGLLTAIPIFWLIYNSEKDK